MKLNLRKLVLGAAIAALPQLMNAQSFNVNAPTEDGYVSDILAVPASNPYLWNEMKLGKSAIDGSGNTTSAIIPFQLPAKPGGKSVVGAKLSVYVAYGRQWINANVDLYDLTFQAEDALDPAVGRAIHPEDHYAGPYAASQGARGAVGIADDYFSKNVAGGILDTPRYEEVTSAELVAYINAQYAAGAVENDWVFMRLSMDDDAMTGAQFFKIEGGDQGHPAVLTIDFDNPVLGNEEVSKQSLAIYPNPVVNGEFTVSTVGMASEVEVSIYSVTGALVNQQSLKASANSVSVSADLSSGLYIVRLSDGSVVKTQKITVK